MLGVLMSGSLDDMRVDKGKVVSVGLCLVTCDFCCGAVRLCVGPTNLFSCARKSASIFSMQIVLLRATQCIIVRDPNAEKCRVSELEVLDTTHP